MSFSLLDKLSGPIRDVQPSHGGLCRHFKYGIRSKVTIKVKGEREAEYVRPTAAFTNVVTTAGRLNIVPERDIEVNDGINARMIDDCGQLSSEHVFESVKASGQVKGWVGYDIATSLTDRTSENFVGVLFNLLRMYYISQMDYDDYKLSPGATFYNDGHVAISYGQHFDFRMERKPEFKLNNIYCDIKSPPDSFGDTDFFPRADTFSEREFGILKTALAGWTCDYPIRLFSSCPPLAELLVASNPTHLMAPMVFIETLKPMEVLSTLQKLVGENRVQSQFDLAYMLLCQAVYMPVPRAAEANGWVVAQYDFYVPKAATVRGANRMFTSGTAYQPRPSACNTWKRWTSNKTRMIVHAAAITEAIYTGVYEVLTRGEGQIDGNLADVGLTPSGPLSRTRAVIEFSAYRFGESFRYPWDTAAGLDVIAPILAAVMEGAAKFTIEKVGLTDGYNIVSEKIGEKEVDRIISNDLKPVMFPVLSYGVNDDRYYLNSMHYGAKLYLNPAGRGIVKGSNDASKLMSIMRLGGYDVTLFGPGTSYRNWAANSNGHCMAIPPTEDNVAADFIFHKSLTKRRDMSWMDLLCFTRGTISLEVDIQPFGYVMFNNGQRDYVGLRAYIPTPPDTKTVKEDEVLGLSIVTNDGKMPYRYSDFLFQQVLVEPETAESILASSDIKQSPSIEVNPEQDSYTEVARQTAEEEI